MDVDGYNVHGNNVLVPRIRANNQIFSIALGMKITILILSQGLVTGGVVLFVMSLFFEVWIAAGLGLLVAFVYMYSKKC